MREIKFRVWNREEKKMVAVSSISFKDGIMWFAAPKGEGKNIHEIVIDGVLMQFTGLHDKNGKEIWEGDVVWIFETTRAVIKYIGAGFEAESLTETYGDKPKTYGWNSFKNFLVLDNIYSNPELLIIKGEGNPHNPTKEREIVKP